MDVFNEGTHFSDVVMLCEFSVRVRAATFVALAPIALAIWAIQGHRLGRTDPCAHRDPSTLGPIALRGGMYSKRLGRYENKLRHSYEDFTDNHRQGYGGRLHILAVTELMDLGEFDLTLGFLSSKSPRSHCQCMCMCARSATAVDLAQGVEVCAQHVSIWAAVQPGPYDRAEAAPRRASSGSRLGSDGMGPYIGQTHASSVSVGEARG